MNNIFKNYTKSLYNTHVFCKQKQSDKMHDMPISKAYEHIVNILKALQKDDTRKAIFIGNGGSAGITSHFSIDYTRTAGIRAQNFNDGASLTCLGNDYGYPYVFSKQLELHAQKDDILFAISSSGCSENILNGVYAAREKGAFIVSLSGFKKDNPLNQLGDISFHVESMSYGFVELIHMTILHSLLDILMGWEFKGDKNEL